MDIAIIAYCNCNDMRKLRDRTHHKTTFDCCIHLCFLNGSWDSIVCLQIPQVMEKDKDHVLVILKIEQSKQQNQ